MKINKNKIITAAIIAIIIAAVFLFISFNIGLFGHRKDTMKKEQDACANLNLNDRCSFFIGRNKVSGKCSVFKNIPLVCRPNR